MKTTNIQKLPSLALLLAGTLSANAFDFSREKNFGDSQWGARITVNAGDHFDKADGEYTLSAKADARARAFGYEKSVVSAEGSFMANKKAHTTVDCQLKLVGLTVWQYENGFEGTVTKSHIGDTRFIKEVTLARTVVPVGPLPITVTVGASLEAYTEFTAGFVITEDDVLADMNYGPVVDVAATASATLDVALASAGVEGKLGLVHQKLAAGTSLSFEEAEIRVYLERQIRGLNGQIDLVGTVRYPVPVTKWKKVKVLWKWVWVPNGVRIEWRSKRYPHTIASFANPDQVEVLWDATRRL
jgi:hypothetical protein